MTQRWRQEKLGYVCDFEGGSQPPKSQFKFEDRPGYVRFLQIRDFGSDKNITYIPVAKKNRLCFEDDILIGRYGASVGKILTGKAGAYNVALMKTLPDLSQLHRSWFYYYLTSDEFQVRLLGIAARSAQAGFSKDDIFNFPVPLPPLAEQRRIVGILDEAFAGIAVAQRSAQQNLQNARALFESHLQAIFTQRGDGWVETVFSDVCEISSSLVDPRKQEYQHMPHVGGANIMSKTGELVDLKTAKDEGLISGKFVFDESVILYSKIRPYLMKVARPDFPGLCSADIYPLASKGGILDKNYLFHLLLSPKFTEYAVKGSARAGMPKVNRDHLFAFRFYLPSVDSQRNFASQLDSLMCETQRLAALYEQKLTALDELKKSLLARAFAGELTSAAVA